MSGFGGTVLLVDDEAYVRHSLATVLERHGFEVRTAEGLEQALSQHDIEGVDAVVTDLKMPGGDGLQLISRVRAIDARTPIIVYTGHGSVASAVDCMQAGATDYLQKPVDPEQMVLVLERAVEARSRERQLEYLRRQGADEAGPVGVSDAWTGVVEEARKVAATDAPVLLLGETGSGKGELAALIHRASPRSEAARVEVSCAAIPLELFESEFFGHRKGSFTGAVADRDGRLKVAHRGTIFLDDIETLPLAAQAKVLRVLESGRFERVGESRSTSVDVRWISASNADLKAEVDAGRFREDLWYRINLMTLEVPPLRNRVEDIRVLAEHFLRGFSLELERPATAISDAALRRLEAYPWPGNVRELRNVIERAALLTDGETLEAGTLALDDHAIRRASTSGTEGVASGDLRSRLLAEEKRILSEALERAGGVRRHAAQELGIDERNMSYYLKKHDLHKDGDGDANS